MKVGVIGSGSFGSAIANLLGEKKYDVSLYGRDENLLKLIDETRCNAKYLPNLNISSNVKVVYSLEQAVDNKDVVVFAIPSQNFRQIFSEAASALKENTIVVNVAKGIEQETLLTLSEVAEEVAGQLNLKLNYVALSGPSHAEEVAAKLPTTVTCAAKDVALAQIIQQHFSTGRFRVYTNDDLIGIQLGGALKNVIALGVGISDGLGFGDNGKAALMTRGIAEISRLGVKMGAKPETFSGLAGIGDLIVTCTSIHSRNRRCGLLIGSGASLDDAVNEVGMVVEGVFSTFAAAELARKHNVQMPIVEAIEKCLHNKLTAKEAIEQLMSRELKGESPFFYI